MHRRWYALLQDSKIFRSNIDCDQHDYHGLCTKEVQSLEDSITDVPRSGNEDEDTSSTPNTGIQIGRYINARHFGDGLFSEVFKAMDPEAQSETGKSNLVALKVTTPEMMTPPHNAKREARLLATAKGANVIELIETFQQAGGRFILVFPFMPFDLGGLLRHSQLNEHSRRQILKDLFSGLAHVHKLGIIHRDIKPSNILMPTLNGPAYIADFGIAWSASDPESEPSDEKILDVGTTCYRPPELLFGGQSYGTKLDMWAAGCVAAQVLCLGSETLFDAGDLGSELALIKSIFETLGTPDLEVWPVRFACYPKVVQFQLMHGQAAADLPDWGKMNFKQYPSKPWAKILPEVSDEAIDLVQNLVIYEYDLRLTADEALGRPFLSSSSP